jgi:hypothetical protein
MRRRRVGLGTRQAFATAAADFQQHLVRNRSFDMAQSSAGLHLIRKRTPNYNRANSNREIALPARESRYGGLREILRRSKQFVNRKGSKWRRASRLGSAISLSLMDYTCGRITIFLERRCRHRVFSRNSSRYFSHNAGMLAPRRPSIVPGYPVRGGTPGNALLAFHVEP